MSASHYRVRLNFYRDSVALMQLSTALQARPGVRRASLMMATPANLAGLDTSGWPAPAGAHWRPGDLLLAVEGEIEVEVLAALDWAEAELNQAAARPSPGTGAPVAPRTLAEGLRLAPEAGLVMISVPGEYAYAEALKALKAGLHVFLFSSGVSLADEARLKRFAAARGLLLMGAECGTALIDGVPLGFANVVRRGNIGLVAASGSGLQEVMCLIHNWGGGISHGIGAGGRDLHAQVGGLTTLAGLRLLLDDPQTEAVVLLSKPPAPAVAARVLEAAAGAAKPIVAAFLGADPAPIRAAGLQPASTLEAAAQLALRAVGQSAPEAARVDGRPAQARRRRYLRGLFSGGTLCLEARLILEQRVGLIARLSLAEPCPAAHTCLDFGEEAYTQGRPHPMIDTRLRAEALRQAMLDPACAVVLFDVILGYGSNPDPVGPLLPAIATGAEGPVCVAHVVGTDADPQGLADQTARLREAGVLVGATSTAAARLAGEMLPI